MAAISWKTAISGNWSDKTNWSSGTVPGGLDDVTIDAAGSYTVTVNGGFNVGSLVFDAPAATINIAANDTLFSANGVTVTGGEIDGPGRFDTAGMSQITAGAPLILGGGATWFLSPGSTVNLSAAVDIGDTAGPTATITSDGATFNLLSDAAGIGVNPSGPSTSRIVLEQ